MKNMVRFLKKHGQNCTILREPPFETKVSMKMATQSVSDNREKFREGLILDEIKGGEVFSVENEEFFTRTVARDYQTGVLSFLASKVNASLVHQRFVEDVDEDLNPIKDWQTIKENIRTDAQLVTAALKQADPGLLEVTKWVFLVADTNDFQKMDRLILPSGEKCQIESVDDIRLPGVLRAQCSDDRRD